jgi:DNA-binding CsgD family transcriptional regulator
MPRISKDENLLEPILKLFFQVVFKMIPEGSGSVEDIVKVTELTEREVRILLMRFKNHEEVNLTYEDIANNMGLTRETVRQIKLNTLRKLCCPFRTQYMLDFLGIKQDYSDWVSDHYPDYYE